MPKFKVGDRVVRIGTLIPEYLREGVITRVIPNKDGLHLFTEYEVELDDKQIAVFYETQLRRAYPSTDPKKG
jgi:Tfp pilus assembly protein PilF